MIRKLTKDDQELLMALLRKEPALNLFIIGDVENFEFEQDFMDLWGEIDPADGRIKAVLLRFYRSYLPYADGPFDVEGFAEIIRKDNDIHMISGASEVVKAFDGEINFKQVKQLFFAELKEMNNKISESFSSAEPIKKATVQDVEAICALTDTIEEFESSRNGARTSLRKTLESNTGRTYYIEREDKVIVTASTSAENSMSAMIVGVATHQAFREQGLASRVMAQLCADLLYEGKSLCLFYDNPHAGVIYKLLGFQDIGSWTIVNM
ncbi:GNAT family N-acetyltransferase [Paenibacillus sp. FSL H7-0323]|jgi:predicted GNAT family acetyltransferase|uniref:GNAT family N-acetyltransferase n=1 Tax=Paenibacillus sp. FSL H7-0323 TaxID=2921433 RepID=UPI0030F81930